MRQKVDGRRIPKSPSSKTHWDFTSFENKAQAEGRPEENACSRMVIFPMVFDSHDKQTEPVLASEREARFL